MFVVNNKNFIILIRFYIVVIFLLPILSVANVPDTISVAAYNLLNYPGSTGLSREPSFKIIIDSLHPDILVVEEVNNFTGAKRFLDSVMLKSNSDYGLGTVINNVVAPGEAENAIYYKKSKFTFLSNTPIYTNLRDINEFKLIHKASLIPFSVFGVHLKAGNAVADITERSTEVDSLRKITNLKPFGDNFIVCGDFNIYSNTETDYVKLLKDNVIDDGEFFDPITMTGIWNNPTYAKYHTQSTRVIADADGGATSGLDDRFDLVLFSDGVNTPGDMDYVSGSAIAYGNDGNHFNDSIDAGTNSMVSNSVAYALHHASDHLPVLSKFRFFNTLLPVELLNFSGKNENNINLLNWSTASELNNNGFEIQRSDDAIHWTKIGFINSNNTRSTTHEYNFIDSNIFADKEYYYRLKQIDLEYTFSYSNTILIKTPNPTELSIFPNPSSTSITISTNNILNSTLRLYDIAGRLVLSSTIINDNTILDLSFLDKGTYFLFVSGYTTVKVFKN